MNLHEFQSKKLFAGYGIPVPLGYAVETAREARIAAEDLGGDRWMVKAQAHTGGRGKAGGVVLVTSPEAVEQEAARILENRIVTRQTGPQGLPVSYILVEQPTVRMTFGVNTSPFAGREGKTGWGTSRRLRQRLPLLSLLLRAARRETRCPLCFG